MKLLTRLGLIVLTITACQSGPGPSPADILIASDFPTTDPNFSIQAQQAVQLAVDEYGHFGHFKVGYVPFNDHLGNSAFQAKGIQNVKHMIADARVLGMIGPWTSNMAYAEIPRANQFDLVMVSPTNTSVCITRPSPLCRPGQPPWQHLSHPNNYFRIAAPEAVQGRAVARYLNGSLGVKRVAAFNEFGDDGELYIKDLGDELARDGGKLVLNWNLDDGTTNFKSFLAAAKAARAEAIYAVGSGDSHVCAARAQMTIPGVSFVGVDAIVNWSGSTTEAAKNDTCLKDALGNGEGMLTATSDIDLTHNTDAVSMQVVAAFRKAYPKITDIQTYVFATYDCARLLIDAIWRAVQANGGGIPTRAQVVSAVAQAPFQGITGTYSFDAHGDALSPMMSLYRVDNGHWVYVKPIDAGAK